LKEPDYLKKVISKFVYETLIVYKAFFMPRKEIDFKDWLVKKAA